MDVFFIPLLIITLYLGGGWIDRQFQHNYFIGGLLPFIGFNTRYMGPMQFRGFYTAWLWVAVCWGGKLGPRR